MKTRSTPLPLLILSCYVPLAFGQATQINTAFMQGMTEVPSVLLDNVPYPAGQYYVDVQFNGSQTTRMPLTISVAEEQAGQLCLSQTWLQQAGIFFQPDAYAQTYEAAGDCYALGRKESTRLALDMGTQTLDVIIPQAWTLAQSDAARWDYGISGLRAIYNGNFNKNIQSRYGDERLNAYGNLNASLNLGRWVLSSDMTGTRTGTDSEFTTNNLTLSTAISQIKGDLILGRASTRTELFSDFDFYGAAVRSNSNMRAWQTRGYAPLITGVAATTSRITITQGGYPIYSKVVPPGPWQLDDISATSNGNLLVTVEDDSGHKTVTAYPVATLPSLLRPGDHDYNVALGQRNDSNQLDDAFSSGNGTFALASVDLGLAETTLNLGTILHSRYQTVGLGVTRTLGEWGAVFASVNGARAAYDDGSQRQGGSVTAKYAKNFNNVSDIQLLTYRYASPGYVEFANWRPDERYRCDALAGSAPYSDGQYRYTCVTGQEQSRFEARLSHRLGNNAYLSGAGWYQTYWDNWQDTFGVNLSANTTVLDGISISLSGNWSSSPWSARDDYSGSLGVSIPFTLGGMRHYSNQSVGYSQSNGASFNTNISATLNDRLHYSVNAGTDARHNRSAGVSASYAFDRIQTNLAVSQGRDTTTLSGNLSGSMIATAESGLLLTRESSDTVAVLRIKDTPDVTFNGSLPTNSHGNTVIYLTGYHPTTISINPENVPDSTELLNTSYDVVPTEKAIIYREFGYQRVLRYILRVRDRQGNIMLGGSAVTEQGVDAGFITNNGVLLMNLLAAPQHLTISQSSGITCRVDATGLKADSRFVQETRCE